MLSGILICIKLLLKNDFNIVINYIKKEYSNKEGCYIVEFKYRIKKIKILYKPYRMIRDVIDNKQLKKRNIAIKELGYEMMNKVSQCLKESDISVFCAYGTLLGFVRENGIIPYDLDLDMGVLENENFSWDKLDNILKNAGLELKHQFVLDDGTITERTYCNGDATIDFFLYSIMDNSMVAYIYEQETYSSRYMVRKSVAPLVEKIIYVKKNDIEIPILSNYDEYLTEVYGKNWKIPDPNFKHQEEILKGRYANIERFKK